MRPVGSIRRHPHHGHRRPMKHERRGVVSVTAGLKLAQSTAQVTDDTGRGTLQTGDVG
jgi:hypothetical protein